MGIARLFPALLLACTAVVNCSAIPLALSYQGHVMVGGNSYDGIGLFKFALLNGPGETVWSQDGTSVNGAEPVGSVSLSLRRGIYTAALGDTNLAGMTAIPVAVFDQDTLILRVWFSDGTNGFHALLPDRPLGAVAFAARAGTADVARTTQSIPDGLVDEKALSVGVNSRLTGIEGQVQASSNSLSGQLIATNAALVTLIDAERAARVSATSAGLQGLLDGTNQWTGSNSFTGAIAATNSNNVLSGSFAGDGSGIVNLSAAKVVGTLNAATIPNLSVGVIPDLDAVKIVSGVLAAARIPDLDASKVTTGLIDDARLSGNIARIADVTGSSNGLSGQLVATNAALVTLIDAERTARVSAISAGVQGLLDGTNQWSGSNSFAGVLTATNANNVVSGSFAGDGGGLVNLSAANVTGTLNAAAIPNLGVGVIPDLDAVKIASGVLAVARIPDLDGAKITAGLIADARLSGAIARTTDVAVSSNSLSGQLIATNVALVALIDTERSARVSAISTGLQGLLDGTNQWSGSNSFAGVLTATNVNNVFGGSFAGDGSGLTHLTAANVVGTLNVATIPNLGAAVIPDLDAAKIASGILAVERIPNLDGAKISSGLIADERLSGNIARLTDVASSSNGLSGQLIATNAALTALIDTERATRVIDINTSSNGLSDRLLATNTALMAQVTSLNAQVDSLTVNLNNLSNKVVAPNQSFSAAVSADPADPELVSKGYENFLTIAARGWVNGAAASAPSPRYKHAAIWTGSELLVWGGNFSPITYSASGARYNPAVDQWQTLTPLDAPSARSGHSAVWTGTEMIIWGGFSTNAYVNSGGRYNVGAQHWTPILSAGSPTARESHVAVWTGQRMLIWGGQGDSGLLADGALYNPSAGSWSALALANAPSAQSDATAVWANDRALIWGGNGETGPVNAGAQLIFDASGNPIQWAPISVVNAPSARSGHTAVWTGSRMVVWGGQFNGSYVNTGGVYDPVNDVWTPVSLNGAPSARANQAVAWTGKEMVISGGANGSEALSTSAAYDPVLGKWRELSGLGSPESRSGGTAAWTGKEFIVFGGRSSGGAAVGSLQRLGLDPNWYFYRKP